MVFTSLLERTAVRRRTENGRLERAIVLLVDQGVGRLLAEDARARCWLYLTVAPSNQAARQKLPRSLAG